MGSDRYLRKSIFSKNVAGPAPAVPDEGAAGWGPASAHGAPPAAPVWDTPAANSGAQWVQPISSWNPAQASAPVSEQAPATPGGGEIPPGWEIEPICPQCGHETPKGRFCAWCGGKLAVLKSPAPAAAGKTAHCAACGWEVPVGCAFCRHCGAKQS
jgi:hypothetical protein